jgi:hypothetical protein
MVYKKVKDMLETALEDVADKGELTSGNLEIIKDLLCSIKYTDDIEDSKKSSYENNSFDSRPSRNYDYGYDYDERQMRSNARRRNTNTDGYTNDHDAEMDEVITKMHELKNHVVNPDTKHKIEKMIKDLRP